MEHLLKLHGFTDSVVSNRDLKFTARLWEHLFKLCRVKLRVSTSHHPQTGGSSEVMIWTFENYLRCYCNNYQNDWDESQCSAKFSYNYSNAEEMIFHHLNLL